MNHDLLKKHLLDYKSGIAGQDEETRKARAERIKYYQAWSAARIKAMTPEEFYEYIAKLWAMLIWGNKKYVVDRLITVNTFEKLRIELAELVWGKSDLAGRWDRFRSQIKGMGPATISEILAHVHPQVCALWNRRAYAGLSYLGVAGLPKYDYQVTGKKYVEISAVLGEIAAAMKDLGIADANLLTADYFIWEELQVEDNLSQMHKSKAKADPAPAKKGKAAEPISDFIHNDIRDKLADIGFWLGFKPTTEIKVAAGSKVDTIWEATIGNMGRVIYVFEVQSKGSVDSLLMNLLKALNNPAVQGVVAVSDAGQIEKIKKHAAPVNGLADKLRCWDYADVLATHARLEAVNESINGLKLVPDGFA